MPWKLRSLLAERKRLVEAVLKGHKTIQQVAGDFGVSRKTAWKWVGRFLELGLRGLRDRSRRPLRSPLRIEGGWRRHGAGGVPVVRTMAGWLKASGMVKSPRRRSIKGPGQVRPGLSEAGRCNEVWTVDFKGWFRTGDGTRVEPLTVRDLFSRYLLAVCLLPDQRWERVQGVFARLFEVCGLPRVIRMDNGGPFGSGGPAGLTRLSVWWTAMGIRVEFIAPAHPEQNGGHEQMHRVLKAETAEPPARTRLGQQQRMRRWVRLYNQERPHEGLGQQVPGGFLSFQPQALRGRQGPRTLPEGLGVAAGALVWNDQMAGRERFIGEAFVGNQVALKERKPGEWGIYFGKLLLGILRADDVGGLRPSAYVRRHRRIDSKNKL